jgi:hypothetical protein
MADDHTQDASSGYSRVPAINGQALRTEGNKSLPWSGLQTELVERTPEKSTSGKPSTKDGIETVRLCAFAPPSSPVDRHSVVVFVRTMNNAD